MEKDYFNLRDYLNNPGGKGSSIGVGLQNAKNLYNDELKKCENNMKISWIMDKKHNKLCAHILLPSKSNESIKYDIVFEFDVPANRPQGESILDYPVKVFSNSPSFVYTYAYAFKKYKRLISWAHEKYPENTLQIEPVSKNPYKQISFERSIYLAASYIKNRRDYLPMITGMATHVQDVKVIKDSVEDMNSLDDKRKDEKDAKLQVKKHEEYNKKYASYTPKHAKPSAPSTTNSSLKKPKPVSQNLKKPKGTKKASKGVR